MLLAQETADLRAYAFMVPLGLNEPMEKQMNDHRLMMGTW